MTFLRQRMEGGVELQKIFLDPNLNNKFMLFQIHIVHLSSHSQVAHPPIGFGSGFGAGFKTKFGDRSTPQPHIRSNDEVIAQTRKYGNGFKKEYSTSSPQPQPQLQQEQEQTSAKVKDRFTPYTRSIGELIKEDEESAEYYSKVHQNDVEVVCVSGNHDSYLPMKC